MLQAEFDKMVVYCGNFTLITFAIPSKLICIFSRLNLFERFPQNPKKLTFQRILYKLEEAVVTSCECCFSGKKEKHFERIKTVQSFIKLFFLQHVSSKMKISNRLLEIQPQLCAKKSFERIKLSE